MKQLLLRVPDGIHRRLAARAARAGRSVNAVATDILDAAIDADGAHRQARLVARAVALGSAQPVVARPVTRARRQRIIGSTSGTGPLLDELLRDERERV